MHLLALLLCPTKPGGRDWSVAIRKVGGCGDGRSRGQWLLWAGWLVLQQQTMMAIMGSGTGGVGDVPMERNEGTRFGRKDSFGRRGRKFVKDLVASKTHQY